MLTNNWLLSAGHILGLQCKTGTPNRMVVRMKGPTGIQTQDIQGNAFAKLNFFVHPKYKKLLGQVGGVIQEPPARIVHGWDAALVRLPQPFEIQNSSTRPLALANAQICKRICFVGKEVVLWLQPVGSYRDFRHTGSRRFHRPAISRNQH